jgi:membrane-associated phospholipid phosphatase
MLEGGSKLRPVRTTEPVAAITRRLPTDRPWVAATFVVVAAYVVLTVTLLIIGAVVSSDGRGGWDDIGANRWFAGQRTVTLNDLTAVGSRLAETLTVIAIALVVVAILLLRRRFAWAGFLVIALFLEVSVFLTTTLLVDRHRPQVPKLDAAPPTSSFPSGHTAAAIVLYGGIAILLTMSVRHRGWRVLSAIVLAVIPVLVGLSRLYRGMHHPTDVVAGALLGLACLAAAGLAIRVMAYDVAAERGHAPDDAINPRSVGSTGVIG